MILLQRKFNNGKPRKLDTFIAGLIGGYLIFGERTAVNEQVSVGFLDSAGRYSRPTQDRALRSF
jgi:hypothetical protein